MIKNIFTRISIFFDILKDFLVAVLAVILILAFTIGIAHNLLKINEVSSKYSGPYKNLVTVGDKEMMNVYSIGNGANTIVILSGFGIQSPVIEYKALANYLSSDYRVVIVEYLGYGYSLKAKTDRTSKNIANEIKKALDGAEINGPYILMPHSISNIYAIEFQKLYPDNVSAIISVDGIMPNMSKENKFLSELNQTKDNVKISSIAEFTGFARILSYVKPEMFYIDKMQNSTFYTDADIAEYRKRIGIGYLTSSMVKEINKIEENVIAEKEYVYPDNLPVLEVLTSESVNKYKDMKKQNNISKDYEEYANELLSNKQIQEVKIVSGDHMIPITDPVNLAQTIKEFIMAH